MSGVMEWLHESLHDNLLLQCLSWFGLVLLGFNASATARVISRRWNDDEISFLVEETGVPGGNHRPCVMEWLSWSDCRGVTKFNWLGNQHDKFTYYHSCHVHLLRGPLRVTSVGSCLNAMPSGSTGGTSRSWQVINLTFTEEHQPDSYFFHGCPSCSSLLERILSQNGKTKARLLLHTLFCMYQFHQAKLSVQQWHMNLWDNATLSFPPRSIFKRHSFSKYMCCSIHI